MKIKKMLVVIPLIAAICFAPNVENEVYAAGNSLFEMPTNGNKLSEIPKNTKCRKIDFNSENHRIFDSRTTFEGNAEAATKEEIFDLCIGSFPLFPSTSVEDGVPPAYYAKYYFIPDPMPVYTITTNKTVIDGAVIEGLDQSFEMDDSLEDRNIKSDDDLFVFYPYDKKHVENEYPKAHPSILGPYQIGYNSFFHNTYRARYFASSVTFDFNILEPKVGSSYTTDAGERIDNTTVLFSGSIYYKLEDKCFRKDVLDYTEECRSIEFYFPKGTKVGSDGKTYSGTVEDIVSTSTSEGKEKSKNTIPTDRTYYMNPGEHYLVMDAKEKMQLRYQKDLGAEFQTVGNSKAYQGQNDFSKEVYFPRLDINNGGTNPNFPSSEKTTVGKDSLVMDGNHYLFKQDANENFVNRCDFTSGSYGESEEAIIPPGTIDRENQNDAPCYHDEGAKYHFWKYHWSDTAWYAEDPYK